MTPERPTFNLGDQTGHVTAAFSPQFVEQLTGASPASETIAQISEFLDQSPDQRIIGCSINPEDPLESVSRAINQQLGFPPEQGDWGTIRGRVAGREDSYALIITGTESLSWRQRWHLNKQIKALNIPHTFIIEETY